MAIDSSVVSMMDRLIYIGVVSTQDPANGTVSVVREEKNDKTSSDLMVLQRGTAVSKDYWMPAVGDQVLCIQLPNFSGRGAVDGFVLGAFYSTEDAPPGGASGTTRVLDHPGDMTIRVGGTLTVTAGTLDVSGGGDVVASGKSLVNHTHTGVHGVTSPPN